MPWFRRLEFDSRPSQNKRVTTKKASCRACNLIACLRQLGGTNKTQKNKQRIPKSSTSKPKPKHHRLLEISNEIGCQYKDETNSGAPTWIHKSDWITNLFHANSEYWHLFRANFQSKCPRFRKSSKSKSKAPNIPLLTYVTHTTTYVPNLACHDETFIAITILVLTMRLQTFSFSIFWKHANNSSNTPYPPIHLKFVYSMMRLVLTMVFCRSTPLRTKHLTQLSENTFVTLKYPKTLITVGADQVRSKLLSLILGFRRGRSSIVPESID